MNIFPEINEAIELPRLAGFELTDFNLSKFNLKVAKLPALYNVFDSQRRVFDPNYLGPTLDTVTKIKIIKHTDFRTTKSNVRKAELKEYSSFNSERTIYDPSLSGPTVTATGANSNIKVVMNQKIYYLPTNYLYRYQGFSIDNYNAIRKNNLLSDNKLKFIVGNSIHIDVLEAIFKGIKF
jgi:DNA (cytosine-5)-methyltransferase 1